MNRLTMVPANERGDEKSRSQVGYCLKTNGRPADSLPLEVDSNLDAVGNLDEGDAAVHPVVLTVEGHCPFNLAYACPLAGKRKRQRLGFRHSANRKRSLNIKGVGAGLHNLV